MSSSADAQSDKVAAAEQSKPTVLHNFDDEEAPEEEVKDEQEEEENETDEEKRDDQQKEIVRENGLSFTMVAFNFIKGLVGAGFLGLPRAFSDARPLYSLALLFAISFINFFVMSNLVRGAQYHYTRLKIPSLSFGDMAEESCKVSFGWAKNHGKLAKTIVNVTTIVHQFGICSLYYLFIANSTRDFAVELSISGSEGNFLWFAIIFFPLVFINAAMTMRILSVLILIGSVLMLFSLTFIIYVFLTNVGQKHSVPFADISFETSVDSLFSVCGTIVFSCLAQPLVLPLENKLKKSSQMLGPLGVLSCGMGTSTIIYAFIGVLGYIAFGKYKAGTLMDYICDTDRTIFVLIIIALGLSIFSSFLLQMFVIVDVLWPHIHHYVKDFSPLVQFVFKLLFGGVLVAVCLVISFTVENLDTITRLIGVTTGALLGFIFPALFDIFTFVPLLQSHKRVSEARARLGLNILVILFGFSILFGGLPMNIIAMSQGKPKYDCRKAKANIGNITTMSVE